MKKRLFFFNFIFTFLLCCTAYSQSDLKAINEAIAKNLFNDPATAKKLSHKYLLISKEKESASDQVKAYFFLAHLSGTMSQTDSVFYYYDKSIQKATEINNQELILYCKVNKADFLFSTYDYDSALPLYIECKKLSNAINAYKTHSYITTRIGNVKYEIGNYKEALSIFKKALITEDFPKEIVLQLKLNIAKTYLKLNEPDSALVYTKNGIADAKKDNLSELEMNFFNQLGLILMHKRNYGQAQKAFESGLNLSQNKGILEISRMILINISRLHTMQNQNKEAISILEGIVLNKENVSISTERSIEIDYLFAENYKALGDFKKSNFYYQKYIDGEKKIGQKKIETIDFIHKMDVSEIENQKNTLLNQKNGLIIALLIFCIAAVIFYLKRRKSQRLDQEKFELLINKINSYEAELLTTKSEKSEIQINKTNITSISNESVNDLMEDNDFEEEFPFEETIGNETQTNQFVIKDDKVNEILEKLIKLEEKKYFLKQECTLHNVAKKLKTNTAYLSKIINNELGKSFSTYINELRINYIIIELKNNSKLRSYSVNAIAAEIGYKRSGAFTKYFKEATSISPTIYIKKINELNNQTTP